MMRYGAGDGMIRVGEKRKNINIVKKDEKIKRCNTFIDTLQNKQAYFKYKTGKLHLPGKKE
jgi:hypothetical protein